MSENGYLVNESSTSLKYRNRILVKNDTLKELLLPVPESVPVSRHLTPVLSHHNLATDYTSMPAPDWFKHGHVVTSVTPTVL